MRRTNHGMDSSEHFADTVCKIHRVELRFPFSFKSSLSSENSATVLKAFKGIALFLLQYRQKYASTRYPSISRAQH